jgi:hypothetical protein
MSENGLDIDAIEALYQPEVQPKTTTTPEQSATP